MPASKFLLPVGVALLALASAPAADLAPGKPPLAQELADLRRDAVEVVFDVQLTARQLREHQRLYAWYWKYATADWQKAEAARLPEFKDAFDKDDAHRVVLRKKHADAWAKDTKAKADLGSPYHRWLRKTVDDARTVSADGPPALRRDHLDNTLEFIQWGLRMQLTVGQQEDFLKMVPKEWNAADAKDDRKTILDEFLPVYRKVVRMTPDQRKQVQEMAEKELAGALKKPESGLDRWLAEAHATANQVLADGPPDKLTAGGALQHADWYDWCLGVRLDDATRAELQQLILQDWKGIETSRPGSLHTARLMDDPPAGGAGELSRLRDTASTLLFICGQPENKVNRAAFEAYRKAHPTKDPLPVPTDDTVIARGDQPLTEGHVERARRMCEWALGLEFTAEEKKEFRDLLLDEWKRKEEGAMAGTLSLAFTYTRVAQLPPAERALVQPFVEAQYTDTIRESFKTDKTDAWLKQKYDAKKPPLVKDQPGATRQDADALGELVHFQVLQVTGGDTATADQVEAVTLDRVKAGSGSPAEIAGARKQLALIRFGWPAMSETDRQELRDRWATHLEPVGVKPKLAAWQATPAPSRELDYLDAMKKLQQQQQATAMISNMMRMQHETNMTIIRNMGSTPYKYQYKYEYRRR
jgi:hypothetical protein